MTLPGVAKLCDVQEVARVPAAEPAQHLEHYNIPGRWLLQRCALEGVGGEVTHDFVDDELEQKKEQPKPEQKKPRKVQIALTRSDDDQTTIDSTETADPQDRQRARAGGRLTRLQQPQ